MTEQDRIKFIVDWSAEEARNRVESSLAWFVRLCESPIERIMFAALIAVFDVSEHWPLIVCPAEMVMKTRAKLVLGCQVQLDEYRVDFVLRDSSLDTPVTVVIECDGHNFHERTAEQALRDRSRDRAIQTMGARVFRFTGREIWRDPIKCAREVFEFLDKATRDEERQDRGIAEGAINRGADGEPIMTINSPIAISPEARSWFDSLKGDLRAFYRRLGLEMSQPELMRLIEEKYGDVILKEVCIPHGLFAGACLVIAAEIAREADDLSLIADPPVPEKESKP